MSLVARTCPRMRKIMFQFNAEFAKDFLVLAPFRNLTELHNWGGDFYTDRFNELVIFKQDVVVTTVEAA